MLDNLYHNMALAKLKFYIQGNMHRLPIEGEKIKSMKEKVCFEKAKQVMHFIMYLCDHF